MGANSARPEQMRPRGSVLKPLFLFSRERKTLLSSKSKTSIANAFTNLGKTNEAIPGVPDTEGPRVTDLYGDKDATRTAFRASNELILVRKQQMDSYYPCMLGQRLMRQQPPKLRRSD